MTDAGARRLAEIEAALAWLEHRLFAALDSNEQATLHELLQRAAAATGGTAGTPAVGFTGDEIETC